MKHRLFSTLFVIFGLTSVFAAEPPKPGGDAITDPKQALAGIPRDVLQDMRPGSRKADDAAVKATEIVRKNVEGKTATFKMTVNTVEKFQKKDAPDVTRIRLKSTNETIRDSGAAFTVFLMAVPDVTEESKLSKITKGSKVTVTGVVNNGEIISRKSTELHIDIMDAKLK